MKKLPACSLGFILAVSLTARSGTGMADDKPAAQGAAALQVVIELADGSRIAGMPTPDVFKITTGYADVEIQWQRMRAIKFSGENHAAQVSLQNGDVLSGELAITEIGVKTNSGEVVTPLSRVSSVRVCRRDAFENSLGMKFVPVPGTDAFFSIWDTRVGDYRVYAEAVAGVDGHWKNPGFKQGEDEPVVMVSWDDAKAFCAWLTLKERKEGRIAQDEEYRLPVIKEWRVAAGPGKYTWGDQWPPPEGVSNFNRTVGVDSFDRTPAAGSFKANQYGLYDMVGNVWQLCGDLYHSDMNEKEVLARNPVLDFDGKGVARTILGAARNFYEPDTLLSSFCEPEEPDERSFTMGFRCVLAIAGSSP